MFKARAFRSLFEGLRRSTSRSTKTIVQLPGITEDEKPKPPIIEPTEYRIITLSVKVPLHDSFCEAAGVRIKEYKWVLRPLVCWNKYILIYVKLQHAKSVLDKLVKDIHHQIDYSQQVNGGAILVHCKDDTFLVRLLRMNSPIFGILFIILRKNGAFDVYNSKDVVPFLNEINMRLVRLARPYPRVVFYIWGVSATIPQRELLAYFKRIGKLISWRFAPIGKDTKYHVIQLQYSRFLRIMHIKDLIKNYCTANMILHLETRKLHSLYSNP